MIVLDEAQTIPVELLKPALAALRELVLNYGCTIVLCTATQPALERREDFSIGLEAVRPIVADAALLFRALRRVEVRMAGKLTDGELTTRLANEHAALCIVNTRRHASRLFDQVAECSARSDCFHLSTWMCGAHRREALKTIRQRLMAKEASRVVSTQMVDVARAVEHGASMIDTVAQLRRSRTVRGEAVCTRQSILRQQFQLQCRLPWMLEEQDAAAGVASFEASQTVARASGSAAGGLGAFLSHFLLQKAQHDSDRVPDGAGHRSFVWRGIIARFGTMLLQPH